MLFSQTAKGASNKRILLAGDACYYNKQISDIYIKHYPKLASKIPTKLPKGVDQQTGAPIGGHYRIDNSFSKKVLDLEYVSFEDTLVEFAESVKNLDQA